jgi:histidyl-tRNA synthetase
MKRETISSTTAQRVLIKALSAANIKEAFKTADTLRKAGYIAEIDLDGCEADWALEIKNAKEMTLINKVKKQKANICSVKEVINLLEGKGGG